MPQTLETMAEAGSHAQCNVQPQTSWKDDIDVASRTLKGLHLEPTMPAGIETAAAVQQYIRGLLGLSQELLEHIFSFVGVLHETAASPQC